MHLEIREMQQLMLQQNEVIGQLQKSVQALLGNSTNDSRSNHHEDQNG
jgi:hypothetical protein